MIDNNRTNHTNVFLNLFQDLNKGIRKKGQGNKFVTEDIIHVITRNNIEQKDQKSTQRDVVIPNKLSNGETCQGLRHWRLLSNLNNNFSKPVHNDMDNKNRLDCFTFTRTKRIRLTPSSSARVAQNDVTTCPPIEGGPKSLISRRGKNAVNCNQVPSPEFLSSPQLTNKFYPLTKREGKEKRKRLIHLSTYRLIDFKKKVAFTLAETLITLGIIGVVAAMTIPNLITTHQQKVTVTKLQKAISVLNQAYKLSFDDVGEPEDAFNMGSDEYFKQYWSPYIKVSTICTKNSNYCGYNKNEPFVSLDGTNASVGLFVSNASRISFLTPDGFLYIIYTGNYATQPDGTKKWQSFPRVLVDINGPTGPNRQGRDVFWLLRTQNNGGGIQPVGYNQSLEIVQSSCSYDASGASAGDSCADYIRRSGWSINKDYPWEMKKNK